LKKKALYVFLQGTGIGKREYSLNEYGNGRAV
jgi:hypothetical protein